MSLPKWSKNGLISMGKEGYKVIPCDSEEEALNIKEELKASKRCAQAGYIINKENKVIYFVLTKNKNKEPITNPIIINGNTKKVYNL